MTVLGRLTAAAWVALFALAALSATLTLLDDRPMPPPPASRLPAVPGVSIWEVNPSCGGTDCGARKLRARSTDDVDRAVTVNRIVEVLLGDDWRVVEIDGRHETRVSATRRAVEVTFTWTEPAPGPSAEPPRAREPSGIVAIQMDWSGPARSRQWVPGMGPGTWFGTLLLGAGVLTLVTATAALRVRAAGRTDRHATPEEAGGPPDNY